MRKPSSMALKVLSVNGWSGIYLG